MELGRPYKDESKDGKVEEELQLALATLCLTLRHEATLHNDRPLDLEMASRDLRPGVADTRWHVS